VQFVESSLREEVAWIYVAWFAIAVGYYIVRYLRTGHLPRSLQYLGKAVAGR
jgi:hypothetical protein